MENFPILKTGQTATNHVHCTFYKTYLISNHLMALLVCDILRQVFAQ